MVNLPLPQEHILRIEPVNNRNNGVYKCVATNSLGTSRLSFSLQVTEEGKAIRNNSSFLSGLLFHKMCLLYYFMYIDDDDQTNNNNLSLRS